MAKWTDYTTDTNPTDTDEVMTLDADKSPKANKRVTLSTLADYFLDKLASKVFAKLETQNQTVIGALNELNSNKVGQNKIDNIYMEGVKDLDNPPEAFILNTGVEPIGLPSQLYSNGCLVIQQNPGNNEYCAQLAFSFGDDKIAIRRKTTIGSWTEWKYFTTQ